MKLYTINEEYINYLRQFSENVKYNKKESRPYVGIILKIDDYTYFAPLGSPKPKHLKMKESLDFIKIDNGKIGVINLNNMIPVSEDKVTNIIFNTLSDKKYATLLESQLRWIERNTELISSKSFKLYKLITTKENTMFHKRCNNFKLLEEKSLEYLSTKEK
ncbi:MULTISPECIES: type III toxin-antitoxin system ToxN/AbiQ family toxin [Fusobacterium]|uniref:type III toxin-antitoxin system ToxN/AbiQ family toxin n=1 Tax=Fusobacterium TaxID=848 RepID=UPI001F3EBDF1|nr:MULTISPECIES: type III toxin-antitoxin system ToxN/AbiQ family toxin [Fusobacterium]MCF2612093.1 type III toxin-antitoxin system ToxN/AbiQ family toxin [Fusobacterium perfoetens]MDY2981371.1 type III toxin-antitoxin system ToxN/AbiQ family toxin [Fusobacterium sp.]